MRWDWPVDSLDLSLARSARLFLRETNRAKGFISGALVRVKRNGCPRDEAHRIGINIAKLSDLIMGAAKA